MNDNLPLLDRLMVNRVLVAAVSIALVVVLVLSGIAWRLEAWTYDQMLGWRGQRIDERVVVVAIDQKSLAELGRWPWSRRMHAQLLDRLAAGGARSVSFNILLTEPALHDPEGDALLAEAMNRYGRVVLPVGAEPAEINAPVQEELPIPELAAAAAGLGHVDLSLDADGVARSMFLQAGLGGPHWPSLALAQYQLDQGAPGAEAELPGLRNPLPESSPYTWSRDYKVLIPYVNPPDGFVHVSYADVLKGRVDPALLRDRWVLVGVTASGLGESLRSPLGAFEQRLAGVDYQANALNMLATGDAIVPAAWPAQLLFSVLLLALPLALYGHVPFLRQAWPLIAATVALAIAVSFLMLSRENQWFSPVPMVLVLALGGALVGVAKLSSSRRQALTDCLTGQGNRAALDQALAQEIRAARRSQIPLSLMMIDVDHFKQLNDRFGHGTGDRVLIEVARTLKGRARRPRDLVARLGGDEFAVLLPETPGHAAWSIASAVQADLANAMANRDDGVKATLSIGIHTFPSDHDRVGEDVMERADAALYRAKELGRNRAATSAELQQG